MQRGRTGRFEIKTAGGETVRAFVPSTLPPEPPLDLGGPIAGALELAHLAIGRLDAVSALLPDPHLFLYTYVRKEALLSSQIEGTQSSLSQLLLFELDQAPGVPLDDVVEVSNYVAALEHGVQRLRSGFPLSNRLLREIHGKLLQHGRGSDKEPGEFRRSQNWIGGERPGRAHYVPPPPTLVPECMGALETFLHDTRDGLPVLVKAALAHVQFESIHPFLDGNGRVGRLLITLLLCHHRVLGEPLLYLSLFLKQNRADYYRLLDLVRSEGDWEAWVLFFLDGVHKTADSAVATARRLVQLFEADQHKVREHGDRTGSMRAVHEALRARPLLGITQAVAATGSTFPTATSAMNKLVALGIAREVTGRRRNRVFAYERYLAVLNEGTEPL